MRAENISEYRDTLETAILLALSFSDRGEATRREIARKKGWVREETSMSSFCPKRAEYPSHSYTFDPADEARLFSMSVGDLVVDPFVAIGSGLEASMLCEDGSLKWSKILPMPRPRGLTAMTNRPHRWFSLHYRRIVEGGTEEYTKSPVAMHEDGSVSMIKPLGRWRGFDPEIDRQESQDNVCIILSVFEDAIRANAYIATVEEHSRISFPVGAEAYKDFLILRDGYRDTPTGRKNPILHWCREHLRSRNGKVFPVTKHNRGAEEIVVGPMRLSIQAGPGYEAWLRPRTTDEGT